MAISFPTSLDNFTNPSSGNTLDSPSHSLQHSDINDAVEAMQRKVGVGTAVAGSASAGQVLTISAAGTSTWIATGLTQIIPSSVAVGSGSGSVDANGAITFSGASSLSINDCFSSTYDNYRIVFEIDTTSGTGGTGVNMRLRVGGADNSSANYWNHRIFGQATTVSGSGATSADTSFLSVSEYDNVGMSTYMYELFSPFRTATTGLVGIGQFRYTSFYQHSQIKSGQTTVTTSYTGFTLLTTSGTMTGRIRVYGYKN